MSLFRRKNRIRLNKMPAEELAQRRSEFPDDLVERCPGCRRLMVRKEIISLQCCPYCDYHLFLTPEDRLRELLDPGSFEAWDEELVTDNPLDFPQYEAKLAAAQSRTGYHEAIITGHGMLGGYPLAIGVMDSRFIMASMGTVVGEKIVRLFERATQHQLPVVLFIASGGARMQEGILSLMQMAKTTQAVSQHSQAGLFYLSVLTHPTTGGVTASFAMQGDIILAEPGATVGFAGRRVIEQTIRQTLPDDFQQAETVLANGFIDRIVSRSDQRDVIHELLAIHL